VDLIQVDVRPPQPGEAVVKGRRQAGRGEKKLNGNFVATTTSFPAVNSPTPSAL
jgi:hypothetical protein